MKLPTFTQGQPVWFRYLHRFGKARVTKYKEAVFIRDIKGDRALIQVAMNSGKSTVEKSALTVRVNFPEISND